MLNGGTSLQLAKPGRQFQPHLSVMSLLDASVASTHLAAAAGACMLSKALMKQLFS